MDISGSKISEFQRLLLEIFSLDPCRIFLKVAEYARPSFDLVSRASRFFRVCMRVGEGGGENACARGKTAGPRD